MNSFAANLTTFPPMIVFLNQLLIGRQLTSDEFLLGLDWIWTMTLMTGWIETDYRANIAAVANYAFRKPSFVALMTHNSPKTREET
jgi:hypothetical protein